MQRIGTAFTTVVDEGDRNARERQANRLTLFSVLLAIVALTIALPQFVPDAALRSDTYPESQTEIASPAASGTTTALPDTYPDLLDAVLPFSWIVNGARLLIAAALLLLLGAPAVLLWRRFVSGSGDREREPFSEDVDRLWRLVERARIWALWSSYLQSYDEEHVEEAIQQLRAQPEAGAIGEEEWAQLRMTAGNRDAVAARLDQLDNEASAITARLWSEVGGNQAPQIRRRFLRRSRVLHAETWRRQTRMVRYRIDLFALCPDEMFLPRTWCIFFYRSTDLFRRSMVPERTFDTSLRLVGFDSEDIRLLHTWLETPQNRRQMENLDVARFATILAERGVRAYPAVGDLQRWRGPLVPVETLLPKQSAPVDVEEIIEQEAAIQAANP
jgi:hypothetical protein